MSGIFKDDDPREARGGRVSRACVGDWHWEQQGEAQGPAVRRGRSKIVKVG